MRTIRIIFVFIVGILPFLTACSAAEKDAPSNPAPPPELLSPTPYTTSGLSVDPAMVLLAQTTVVSVMVTSTGEESGNCTVVLNVDGQNVKSQNVTLNSGESRNVTFYYYSTVAGNHTLRVGNSTGELMVHVVDVNAEMHH